MKKYWVLLLVWFCFGSREVKGQYTVLLDFNDTNGANPSGSLTILGNIMYGMAGNGGKYNAGCVFSLHTNGAGYKDLLDFNLTNGGYPTSSLTLLGAKIFGMTSQGGVYNYGNLFSIDTNGNTYKDFLDFNDTNGNGPSYNAFTLQQNILYGTTYAGTSYNMGNIFSIDTSGSNFTDIYKFKGTNDGANPTCKLILAGKKLYGTATWRGTYHDGTIYSIDTNGSNYKVLLEFSDSNGAHPQGGSLILIGSKLYGMTQHGGVYHYGCIFSVDKWGRV